MASARIHSKLTSRAAQILAISIACASLVSWPVAALAWSARGHAMVADIATKLLTPSASAQVSALLQDDLRADGQRSGRKTLVEVASWPDELRETPEQRATGAYHFDDVPICGVPDKSKYCPDGKCGTVWFAKQTAILADRSQPPRARNEALKWIVHLAGDLHQPLHASDHDDRGGNDVRITFLGRSQDDAVPGRAAPFPYNLHTAWDRLIPYRLFDARGGYDRFLADMPSALTRADWEVGTMDQWAAESFVLARDFLYPALPTDFVCGRPITAVVPLDERYDGLAAVVVEMQLKKAGVRLAKVLNDLLSDRK